MKKTTLILGAAGVALALACGGGDDEATTEAAVEEPVEEVVEEPAEEAAEEPAEEAAEEPAKEAAEAPASKSPANSPIRKGGKGKMKGKSGR